jgi:hypothetical protein
MMQAEMKVARQRLSVLELSQKLDTASEPSALFDRRVDTRCSQGVWQAGATDERDDH